MAGYRKHWFTNALGQKYDLTEKSFHTFLNEPQGFGFQKSFSSIRVGNSELVVSSQYEMTDISGELLFYDSTIGEKYQRYQAFMQFLKFTPIEFHYQTPNELKSYYSDVIITVVDKTEVSSDNILHVPITMHRLSEWLDDIDNIFVFGNDPETNGKIYDLERPYHYAGTTLSNASIYNSGTDDVGFTFIIDGDVLNPQFTLSQAGEQYGVCKIQGTYDYVSINSVEKDEYIYLERNGSAITNPEQFQDLTVRNGSSYVTWIKLKTGESAFTFTCGNIDTFDGTIMFRFKNSYISV